MRRRSRRGGAVVVVLDEQLAGRGHGTKWIIVRGERVKVEPELGSADAVGLCDEGDVVEVVFGRGGGGLAGELLFLERLSLRLRLGSGEHGSAGSDDGVGRATSSLGKRRIEQVTAKSANLRHGDQKKLNRRENELGKKKGWEWLI